MIELKNLSKQFETADGSVDALKHINLTVQDGDIYGIIGMSGAGKSTLVRCINMLEKPTEGSVYWDGKDLGAMSEKELRAMRRRITMIFQSFNLLMQRSCLKNVTLGYTLPASLTSKVGISKVRVYAAGDNMFVWSKRKGLDPRQSFDGTTGYVYSALSAYSLGLNVTF